MAVQGKYLNLLFLGTRQNVRVQAFMFEEPLNLKRMHWGIKYRPFRESSSRVRLTLFFQHLRSAFLSYNYIRFVGMRPL